MCIAVSVGLYYRTREGNKAFIAGRNPFNDDDKNNVFIGWVRETNGDCFPVTWNVEGHFDPDLNKNAPDDLMEVWQDPINVKFYVNIFRGADGPYAGEETYATREEAEAAGKAVVDPRELFPYVRTEELTDTVIPNPQFVGAPVEEKESDEDGPDDMTVTEFKKLDVMHDALREAELV